MLRQFKNKLPLLLLLFVIVASLLLLGGYVYRSNIPVLQPKGWVGVQERDLLVLSTLLMLIVVIPVFIMAIYFMRKYRRGERQAEYSPDWDNSYTAEAIWWGIPFVIIFILSILTYTSSHTLDPYRPLDRDQNDQIASQPLTIQVVALPWKWLFIYPEQKIATVNYLQIPKERTILFEITADAPMNSFWIPQLGGQIFAMPGMKTKLHLVAHEVGKYEGASANLSGLGFAGMAFSVESVPEEEFSVWVQTIKNTQKRLDLKNYIELAKPSQNEAVTYYTLFDNEIEGGLFNWIFMKFMMPMKDHVLHCQEMKTDE